eukprot:363525-Chlamydomonas_euryale.AAC.3
MLEGCTPCKTAHAATASRRGRRTHAGGTGCLCARRRCAPPAALHRSVCMGARRWLYIGATACADAYSRTHVHAPAHVHRCIQRTCTCTDAYSRVRTHVHAPARTFSHEWCGAATHKLAHARVHSHVRARRRTSRRRTAMARLSMVCLIFSGGSPTFEAVSTGRITCMARRPRQAWQKQNLHSCHALTMSTGIPLSEHPLAR